MGFLDAKQARPVDDPSALVPFGWAPGGYHCAACADCGQSHSGSDKRSTRCQDCAEALRDNPPSAAPMTAVDHAELKRLADELREASSGRGHAIWERGCQSCAMDSNVMDKAADAIDAILFSSPTPANLRTHAALLSEIEGLKAERDAYRDAAHLEAVDGDAAEAALRTQALDSWRPDFVDVKAMMIEAYFSGWEDGSCGEEYDAWTAAAESERLVDERAPALRPQTAESA